MKPLIKPKRVVCPNCGRRLTLNKEGLFKGHLKVHPKRGELRYFEPCPGSFKKPLDFKTRIAKANTPMTLDKG